ncbi:RRP17 [Lepeophtheirus salmonis]|uniref:Nucleolar protein 12 n=1 Tax=Lepeophtheirus salmonis TaxID=72036 RepID=A0A7R8CF27_LEPSM|nr:RRP17 [Lepeophtheirus salmonis]CAF2802089.1 RRP17 [Lepeophtheirus salmonis]
MGNTRRPKNRKTKTSVEFNEEERVSFLTGFRKRKNERRKQAKVQMDKEFKEQLAEARSSYILPEVESLLPESTIKTDTHTVSITPMDSLLTPDVSMDPQTFIKPSEKKTINKLTLKAVAKSRAFKMKKHKR